MASKPKRKKLRKGVRLPYAENATFDPRKLTNYEDRAARLGAERRELDGRIEANTRAVVELLKDAEGTGVSYDQLAQLIGVSRQTLYHWREGGQQ